MTKKHEIKQEQGRSTSLTWKGDPLAKTLQTNGKTSVTENEAGPIAPAVLEMPPETGVRSLSSAVEHHVDIVGVTGSIPVATTIQSPSRVSLSVTFRQDRPSLTREQKETVARRSGYRCVYCGVRCKGKGIATFDHIIPVTRAGMTITDNVVLACRPCNSAKCDRSVEELRHHLALRDLGWPQISKEALKWAERRGAHIGEYLNWRFWFEREAPFADATRKIIEAAIHGEKSGRERLRERLIALREAGC